jgi:DNA (cytosine-5)-methyltransferase 1
LVFDEVQTDLEAEGYEVLPFLLPACGVNAPHRRDRVWFIAYSINNRYKTGCESFSKKNGISSIGREEMESRKFNGTNFSRFINNTYLLGCEREWESRSINKERQRSNKRFSKLGNYEFNRWQEFPTKPAICGGDDGISRELDGITFSKWRQESIKAYGNAIVPQVAYEIFKTIKQIEHEKRNPRP